MASWFDLDITNSAYWPLIGTQVNASPGGGTGALIFAVTNPVSPFNITGFVIISGGVGYSASFSPTITGAGTGGSVTLTSSGGVINGFTSLVGGINYVGTSPALKLNFLANVWSKLISALSAWIDNVNGNGKTLSNLGNLTFASGSGVVGLNEPVQTITLANGANNNVAINGASYVFIQGPTGAFSLNGIAGGTNGQRVLLWNNTSFAMTLAYLNAGSSSVNRIYNFTLADLVIPAGNGSCAELIYDPVSLVWRVLFTNH